MDNNDLKSIWSKGLQKQEPVLTPQKMNEMMNRESGNLIEKIQKTARADQQALPFVSLLVVGLLVWFGFYSFAIFLAGVFTLLYFYNKAMLRKLEQVEMKDSVLKYLHDFRSVARKMIQHYTWVASLGTLLFGLPMLLLTLEVAGIPMDEFLNPEKRSYSLTLLLSGIMLFSGLSAFAYRLSVRLLYGQKLRKIDEMIANLVEEL